MPFISRWSPSPPACWRSSEPLADPPAVASRQAPQLCRPRFAAKGISDRIAISIVDFWYTNRVRYPTVLTRKSRINPRLFAKGGISRPLHHPGFPVSFVFPPAVIARISRPAQDGGSRRTDRLVSLARGGSRRRPAWRHRGRRWQGYTRLRQPSLSPRRRVLPLGLVARIGHLAARGGGYRRVGLS
jgi:hypothetical protein